ncbi:uncharacterized protein LOC131071423 isoform X2 [Cryptomeria japonica]|nr:uncharacterized protein LOC131071423 isoform X2 [Cryptomeria japonica]
MNSRLQQVAAVVKLSAKFTSLAWRSNKTLSELNAGVRAESFNRPEIIVSNEDEGKDGLVGMDGSSMVVDETCNPSWSELTSKLRAERINCPQITLSNEDEDEDSFVGMDESSMVVDETKNSSWSELTAKLRAETINRPQIVFSNEDEDEDSFADMDESSMVVDETYISSWSEETAKLRAERIERSQMIFSGEDEDEDNFVNMDESSVAEDETQISSSSSSSVSRPSSLQLTKENANSVSLIGSICSRIQFKYTDPGRCVVWTSIDMRDKNFCISGRFRLYFLDELAEIARQHLKINDCVYVSGELEQLRHMK